MNGGKCTYDCAYCTRARSSTAREEYLCRVPWPPFEEDDVLRALGDNEDRFSRICLQMVNSKNHIQMASRYVEALGEVSSLPISVEIRTRRMKDIEELLDLGADYVGLPLDVASSALYPEMRGGTLEADFDFLLEASEAFGGRVGTHLIVGLGEREEEMVELLRGLAVKGVTTGLFAFTPCRGTRLEKSDPPSLSQYRNIQLANHLILSRSDGGISFNDQGSISSFGLEESELAGIPSRVFETQGCEGCNRPYYNERPIGRPYNYPRGLTEDEFQLELQETWK
jgi:biotin synthase